MNNYKPTIGIEIHLELKTKNKVFSPSKNSYNDAPNTNINEIDLAYPGTLPVVSYETVQKAIKACLGLNMNITKEMYFDRKNYFYPDLPKGYQITQFHTPIGRDGYIILENGKKIRISDIHIEEDTCKSLHYNGKTLLNYNRAGVPLIEIVSYPDMHTKEEAMDYAEAVRKTMLYLNISDCKIEEGSFRCDVNISVSKDETLGVRSEIKNIGSIKNIGEAIEYEIERQTKAIENGETLKEDTRKYDESSKATVFMRAKDSNTDYRYFPEPDIPYLYLTDKQIEDERKTLEMLPAERIKLYEEKNISKLNIDKLIQNKDLSDFINSLKDENINFQIASNLLLGDISSYLNKNKVKLTETNLTKDNFILVVNSLAKEEISSKTFKELLEDLMEKEESIKEKLEQNKQTGTTEEVQELIEKVLDTYPESVKDYKNGKENAFKFLMGMVMKESKGKINPKIASNLLLDNLNK